MRTFSITNATLVLPAETVPSATIHVHDGVIVEVEERTRPVSADTFDARGALLTPGAVDLHNDSLEFEVNPRPGANLPLPLAIASLERRLVAAGVTTEFHAIAFMERPSAMRSVDAARERSRYIAELAHGPERAVDHQVLHRIDVWHPEALGLIFESLAEMQVPYASLNDHTPGQGQYRNVEKLLELSAQQRAMRGEGFSNENELLERMRTRSGNTDTVPYVYSRVQEARERQPMLLATHDDDTPEKVDAQWELGARVAEFPVTMESAQRARDRGMAIVVGAPNILRGGSQSGNLAAADLLRAGLADVICADYHEPSLFASAFRFVQDGLVDLPQGIRMVTLNAARAVGLADRGAIEVGQAADLALLATDAWGLPHVQATFRRGRLVYAFGDYLEQPAGAQPLVVAGS